MMTWDELKNQPIAAKLADADKSQFADIAGGVSYPGNRPGFAVIAGLRTIDRGEHCEIYVLDEFESVAMRKLLSWCHATGPRYNIDPDPDQSFRWAGDYQHAAAGRIVGEINDENRSQPRRDNLSICGSSLLDSGDKFYAYIPSIIKGRREQSPQSLFTRGSMVENYLSSIQSDDPANLRLGDYPAMEALAFVDTHLRQQAYYRLDKLRQSGQAPMPPDGRNRAVQTLAKS
jgi:hypothetical protein